MADQITVATQRLTREQIAAIVGNNPRAVKLFENLLADVSATIPEVMTEQDRAILSGHLGVFGSRPQPVTDTRAGDGISIVRDAAGYLVAVDLGFLVSALAPFLRKPAQAPDVRPGTGVAVSKDAAGYVVSSTIGADNADGIIANRVFRR